MTPIFSLRQGDVLLVAVAALPSDCAEVPPEGQRLVLAHGEATGHAYTGKTPLVTTLLRGGQTGGPG